MEFYYSVSNPALAWVFALLYFVPCVVGFVRKHSSRFGILVLNLFLGWTFIFWVVSLAWALGKRE